MYSNQLLVPRRSFVRLQSPDSNGAKSFLSNKNNDALGNVISIKKKVIKIESLLKKDKKILNTQNSNKKREEEKDNRLKKEEEKEGKNRAKFFSKLAKRITPRTGILDWIKNFVSWLLIGSLFETFYNMIPTILNVVKFLEPLYKFFEIFAGVLFEGLVTFIDLGYKAYDTFRGVLKTLGGEPFAKAFDDFSGALNKLLNLGIVLAMAYAFSPDLGPKQKPGAGQRARPGQGGRPKVTTSGGGGLGRPDIRNPFREAPKVTQGGATPKFRLPGSGPKVTGSGGSGGFFSNFKMPKVSGSGLAKGAGTFGLGFLIDMTLGALIDKFIADPLSNASDNYRQSKIDEALSSGKYSKQELINKIQSRLKEEQSRGLFTDNKKIEILTKDLEYVQKKESGGLVNLQPQNIKPQRNIKRVKLNKNLFNIPPEKTQPGKDIGGKEKAEMLYSDKKPQGFFSFWGGLFGGGDKKEEDKATDEIEEIFNLEKDPVGTIKSLSASMKRIPLLGGVLGAALDLLLGQKPNKSTFANFYSALGHLMTVVTGTEGYAGDILKSLLGFEEGGLITTSNDQNIDEENYTKLFKKTLGDPLEYRFAEAFGRVKKEVNKIDSTQTKKGTKPEEYLTPTTDEISTLGSGGGSLKDLTDKDYDDLAYIVSGEAARGTDDEYGVAAAVLNRVASPVWPNTIMGVGTQPGQFEAVEKGTARRDPALAKKLKENQAKIVDALNKLNGRDSFKGQSQLSNKGSGDIMFHPRGNFYHYRQQQRKTDPAPQSPDQSWKKLLGPSTGGSFSAPSGQPGQQNIPSSVPKGSVVQWLHGNPSRAGYRPDHGGQANAHDHFSFKNRQAAVSAFLKLRQAGYKPYEFEGYTSVGKHSATGGHYGPVGGKPTYSDKTDGTAFDIPWATYGSGPISQKDFDKSLKAAQIVGAAQGGGYINSTYKKINNTSGLNNYASYDDSSSTVLIQPVYIEKVISNSGGGLSFGSSGSSLTKSVGPKFQSLAR